MRPEPPPASAPAQIAVPDVPPPELADYAVLCVNPTTQAGERPPYLLAKLKASRVLERLEQTAERARTEEWPYEQFLEALLEAEVFARDASGARQRVRAAQFPQRKTLEDFDWQAQPAAERALVLHLAQLAWIDEHANVCFLGPPGTGKTHLAIALAMKACEHGYRVAFATAQEWVSRLEAAQDRTGSRPSCAASSATTCSSSTRSATCRSSARRRTCSSRSSHVATSAARSSFTSNRSFEQWGEILGDAMVAAALIDRLVHHATMVAQGQELPPQGAGRRHRAGRSASVARGSA